MAERQLTDEQAKRLLSEFYKYRHLRESVMNIPHDHNLGLGTWCVSPDVPDNILFKCPNGHIGILDHDIADDGTVSPSVDCMTDGCEFHAFIVLDDWWWLR